MSNNRTIPKLTLNLQRLRAALRDTRAVSAVEFALMAPLLIAIWIPVVDLGAWLSQKTQVQDAAQAGAQFALINGWDSTGIQNAVTSATKLSSITASPAPSRSCGCATGTAVSPVACGSVCADGANAGLYVTVNAKSFYTPLISYPMLGSSISLVAASTVRINQ
jgi:Flp pilus assembly protein TadG